MADNYGSDFRRALGEQPLRQIARLARFQLRKLNPEHRANDRVMHDAIGRGASVLPTTKRLRPPPHHYQGYAGPWIEDYFFSHWMRAAPRTALAYLPVFWTDLYLHAQTHCFTPAQQAAAMREVREVLDQRVEPARGYFTVLEYDHMIWDWHLFPRNVVVFSAGGWGDVPVPLLKGSPPFSCPLKDIPLSFVGRLDGASDITGARGRMHTSLREHALFTSGPQWREIMARSTFSLCPRGLGRASFRLYEALSVGSIPIYLWDDCAWLPYRDTIDWSEIAISLPIDRVGEIPSILASYSPDRINAMQRRIAEIYDDYFTLPGMCRQITAHVELLADRGRFRHLMEKRSYPPGMVPARVIPEAFAG